MLITLAVVTLVTILLVGFLLVAKFERVVSNQGLGYTQAKLLADLTADTAIERLREAIDIGRQPGYGWASEPGRIDIFNFNSPETLDPLTTTYGNMFSAPPGPDDSSTPNLNNVDLNQELLSGQYPVTGTVKGTMKVGWINILANPALVASQSNPIVGRMAYWVDDESCKVNINVANGSHKNDTAATMATNSKYSYGFGVPSEISLQALSNSAGTYLTAANADLIATYAATTNFNSAAELGLISGLPSSFYPDNKFNLTHTSRSPDINMFGEPRIALFPANVLSTGKVRSMLTGFYGIYNLNYGPLGQQPWSDTVITSLSSPIDFIYPTSSQLPSTPPQYEVNFGDENVSVGSGNGPLGLRIANYLNGKNSQGQAITWPKFAGASGAAGKSGPALKYTPRQLDSIVAQILDLTAGRTCLSDQFATYSDLGYMPHGYLSNDLVCGVNRAPKLTEVNLVVTTNKFGTGASYTPVLQFSTVQLEFYFPKYYAGAPLSYQEVGVDLNQWHTTPTISGGATALQGLTGLNYVDLPYNDVASPLVPPGQFKYWGNNMLQILDDSSGNSSGNPPAGIDIAGCTSTAADPDQANAAIYHPYLLSGGTYVGANNSTTGFLSLLGIAASPFQNHYGWPGEYQSVSTGNSLESIARYGKRGTGVGASAFQLQGGLNVQPQVSSGSLFEAVPLDGMRGGTAQHNWTSDTPSSIAALLLAAVIPVTNAQIPIPGQVGYLMYVTDPLVNKFPGDWQVSGSTTPPTTTMDSVASYNPQSYMKGGSNNNDLTDFPVEPSQSSVTFQNPDTYDGDNPGYKPVSSGTTGGDPLSVWLPTIDQRLPKQARVPSVGELNSIRTGIIPDNLVSPSANMTAYVAALPTAHGTPWRSICFDAESGPGQTTATGTYPDWAMLDLFNVPFLPQDPQVLPNPPPGSLPTANPIRRLTSGGSTEGRLNINNPAIPYPFSQTYPGVTQTPPTRTAPLQALFYGFGSAYMTPLASTIDGYEGNLVSTSYDASSNPLAATVDPVALGNAVQTYLAANGPFMIPGQLANVPAIAAYTYRGVAAGAQSRNDLMKNVYGSTTTQSNTFSIWVVAQTIKKIKGNTNYGIYEKGDVVTGEVRRRYIVERFIEPGKDGVPGNANAISNGTDPDGVLGTADDPIDSNYNPTMTYPLPYRWRIISTEDIVR